MLYRIKQIINNDTVSGYFAIIAMFAVPINWMASIVLMGMALLHWWNPNKVKIE